MNRLIKNMKSRPSLKKRMYGKRTLNEIIDCIEYEKEFFL
jgi:hypothetical protein